MSARRKTSHKMFQPPKDPFEVEDSLQSMQPQPLDSDQKQRMIEIANELIGSDRVDAREKKALKIWKVSILAKGFEGIVKQEFQRDFWRWLVGRGKESDHQKTQWYRDKLTDDIEVSHYVDSFVSKYHMFRVKLKLLSMRRPVGINQTYLYFKYVVRGKEANEDNFLDDWDIMIKEFDEAGRDGPDTVTWQEPRRPGYGPHEVRPWGPKAIEAAKDQNTREKQLDRYTSSWPKGPEGKNPPKDEHGDLEQSESEDGNLKPDKESPEEASVEVIDAEVDDDEATEEPMLQVVSRLDQLIDIFEQDLSDRRGNPKWPSDKGKEEDDSEEEEQSMSLSVEQPAAFEDLAGNNLAMQQYYEAQAASLRSEMLRKDEENQQLVQEIRESRDALNRIQDIQAINRGEVQQNVKKLQQQLEESQKRGVEIQNALATAQNFAAESEAQRVELKKQHEKTLQGQEAQMRDFVRNAQSQIDQMGQAMRAGNVLNINEQQKQVEELQQLVKEVQEQAKTDLINLNERHQAFEQTQELNFQKTLLEEAKKVEGAYAKGYKEAEKRLMEETQVQIEEMNSTFAQTFAEQEKLIESLQASAPQVVKTVMEHAEEVEEMEEEMEDYEIAEIEQIAENPIVIEALGESNRIRTTRKRNKEILKKRNREVGASNKRLLHTSRANEEISRRNTAQKVAQKNAPVGLRVENQFSAAMHDSEAAVQNARDVAGKKIQKVHAGVSRAVAMEKQAQKQESWNIQIRKEEINEDLNALRQDQEDLLQQQELLEAGAQARDKLSRGQSAKARRERRALNNVLETETENQKEAEAIAQQMEIEQEQDELLQDMEEEERREALLQEGENNLEVKRAATAKVNAKNLESVIGKEEEELADAENVAREMEIEQEQDRMTELLMEEEQQEKMEEELAKNLKERNALERDFNANVTEAQAIAISSFGRLSAEQLAQMEHDQSQLQDRLQELEKIRVKMTQDMLALKESEKILRGGLTARARPERYQRVSSSQKGTTSVKNMGRVRNAPMGSARGRNVAATISQSNLKESETGLQAVTRNLAKEMDQMRQEEAAYLEKQREKREREMEKEEEEELGLESMEQTEVSEKAMLQDFTGQVDNAESKETLEKLRDVAAATFGINVSKLRLSENPGRTELQDFKDTLQKKLQKKRKKEGIEMEEEHEVEGPLTQTLLH